MSDAASVTSEAETASRDTRTLLNRLDPTQSLVLQMLYFERSTHHEIAVRLKLSRRTVLRKSAAGMQALAVLILAPATD